MLDKKDMFNTTCEMCIIATKTGIIKKKILLSIIHLTPYELYCKLVAFFIDKASALWYDGVHNDNAEGFTFKHYKERSIKSMDGKRTIALLKEVFIMK